MQNENKRVNQSRLAEIPITDSLTCSLGILTEFIDSVYRQIVGFRRTS
jgi:hypothetical protein